MRGLDKVEWLEVAVDDGGGLQPQPGLQNGGIRRAEVVIEMEITLELVCLFQRGILAVHPAVHGPADDEGGTTGAMVGASAVVSDTAAKLGP